MDKGVAEAAKPPAFPLVDRSDKDLWEPGLSQLVSKLLPTHQTNGAAAKLRTVLDLAVKLERLVVLCHLVREGVAHRLAGARVAENKDQQSVDVLLGAVISNRHHLLNDLAVIADN
jgi:hypothetical protein